MVAAGAKNDRSIHAVRTMLTAGFVLSGMTGIAVARYPKVNLAIGYEVDPDWPDKPDDIHWRYMTGVAVDAKDRVWTLNAIAPQVQVYSTEGKLLDAWEGDFKMPHFIRIDPEGHVWAADFRKHVIMKFTEKGKPLLTLGTPDKPGDDETHLNGPTDMAFAPNGDVFVTDGYGNNRVVHFNKKGEFVKTWGKLGQAPGELSQPHSIALDSEGRLYVAERNNCRIQIFDQSGKYLGQWRNLVNPWGLWMSPKDELYVCGSAPARWTSRGNLGNPPTDQLLMIFDTTGRALQHWVFPLAKEGELIPGHLDWIHGIAVDSKGNLYLSDVADNSKSHRVQKFNRLAADR